MLPSSLNMMGAGEAWQEGNYASLDHSISGRSLLQNDLGLTLLPGSQIQQIDEGWHQAGDTGSRIFDQTTIFNEDSNKLCDNGELSPLRSDGSRSRKENGYSHNVALGNRWDMGQTLAWIEGRRTSLADKELQASEWEERLSDNHDLLQHAIGRRSRYGSRVRVSKNVPQGDKDESSRRRKKTGMTRSSRLATITPVADRVSTTDNCSLPPHTVWHPQHALPLSLTDAKKPSPKSLTSAYPDSRKPSHPSHKQSTDQPLSPKSSDRETCQSTTSRETGSTSRDERYERIQAKLRQTKLELYTKTKAESDAKQMIDDLHKAYNDLRTSTSTVGELSNAHCSLLVEYGQVLNMYKSLAHKHSACRGPSSKKLARRIAESHPLSNDSGYASRSSSIVAPLTFPSNASNSGAETINDSLYLGSPLIDLTATDVPAPLPATTNPIPDLAHEHSVAEHHEPITDQSSVDQGHDDANYANINGFDEEANELFDALWEQEMASLNTEEGAE